MKYAGKNVQVQQLREKDEFVCGLNLFLLLFLFPHLSLSGNRSQWENHSEGCLQEIHGCLPPVIHEMLLQGGGECGKGHAQGRGAGNRLGMKGGDHWSTGIPISVIPMEAEGLLWREVSAGGATNSSHGSQQENWELRHSRSSPQCLSMGGKLGLIPKKHSIKCL